ncbi:FAD-dependent oxidoreductase [Thioalkalivibrio sp. ALE11]|uniref:FAD-dependent oxidoreductase n=1 Tax=Thioalkalivibrio sp. ALE11 TaxID=1265494 RepID=UPI00037503F4|nr:FAD-dependent oxidoreductase [Thioalkalivibrio sp. ALE11]
MSAEAETQTEYRRYICRVCGYIYDEAKGDPDSGLPPGTRFEDIPDDWYCPDCNVTKADFDRLQPRAEDPVEAQAAQAWRTPLADDPDAVVVVGGGMAGWAMAEELRARDPERSIRLVTGDRGDYYTKPRISTACARGVDPDDLMEESGVARAARLGVELLPHVRLLDIDRQRRRLITPRGGIPYGDLVLATGASPIRLDIPGDGPPPRVVNTLDDYRALRAELQPGARVAILGAGLVGSELADDLAAGGYSVDLIEMAERPLARLAPPELGDDLAAALAQRGVALYTGTSVACLEALPAAGEGPVASRLTLAGGETLEADVVITALGLRPNIDVAVGAGLDCGRGIRVDATLATSDPAIRALGDCAEYDGVLRPYVGTLRAQAEVIADRLAGGASRYAPDAGTVQVKTTSLPMQVCPPSVADAAAGEWVSVEGDADGRRMEFHADGRLAGFALSGALTREAGPMEARLGEPVTQPEVRARMAS